MQTEIKFIRIDEDVEAGGGHDGLWVRSTTTLRSPCPPLRRPLASQSRGLIFLLYSLFPDLFCSFLSYSCHPIKFAGLELVTMILDLFCRNQAGVMELQPPPPQRYPSPSTSRTSRLVSPAPILLSD
jgi:hypothetical protein